LIRRDVAALYVDRNGPYPHLVERWYDRQRDARLYAGPLPVVAHPPCGPWGSLRHLSSLDDPQLALIAVAQVRHFGGVLEHPAHSKLFDFVGLPSPGASHDAFGGRTIEIAQCDFGHVARKRTWLYLVRCAPLALPRSREPSHYVAGTRNTNRASYDRVPEGIKICSAAQRRKTPWGLAHWLLAVAASAACAPIR
jgi:hypothetical protein